jgi:hypothetical protein
MAILFLATIMGSLGAAEDVLEPGVPEVPENPDGTGTTFIPVETPPPQPEPYNPLAMFNPLLLLVIILVIGALAAYVPGEVQRMRIETAFRESMDARLALAKGDFTVALAGFDRAIDQAHQAYTRPTSSTSASGEVGPAPFSAWVAPSPPARPPGSPTSWRPL